MHYAAPSALEMILETWTWAVGPGYYIERFQRFKFSRRSATKRNPQA